MKEGGRIKMILTGILAFLLIFSAGSVSQEAGKSVKDDGIPGIIVDFYENYSFIGSFSTRSERMRLAGYLDRSLDPPELKNPRLKQVLSRMRKICSRILRIDPDMIHRDRPNIHLFRSAVIEVRGASRRGDKMILDVAVFLLEPDHVLRYIREFDTHENAGEYGDRELKKRILEAVSRSPEQREFHTWLKTNRSWFKGEVQLIQLKR